MSGHEGDERSSDIVAPSPFGAIYPEDGSPRRAVYMVATGPYLDARHQAGAAASSASTAERLLISGDISRARHFVSRCMISVPFN